MPAAQGRDAPDSRIHLPPWERRGLTITYAKWNRKAGFRNRAYSPGTHEVFPVQRLLPVGREVRRAS